MTPESALAPREVCSVESSALRRLRGEARPGGDMVVTAVWKETLLVALEEAGLVAGMDWWVCGWEWE
jgi:hypothetical protein